MMRNKWKLSEMAFRIQTIVTVHCFGCYWWESVQDIIGCCYIVIDHVTKNTVSKLKMSKIKVY